MKTWYQARTATSCGRCGDTIKAGEHVLELGGIGWKVQRCHRCASQQGESLPEHVAEGPSPAATIRTNFAERIASVRGLARDFKHAQGNDR